MPLAARRPGDFRVPLLWLARGVWSVLRLPWRARLPARPGASARTRSPAPSGGAAIRAGSRPERSKAASPCRIRRRQGWRASTVCRRSRRTRSRRHARCGSGALSPPRQGLAQPADVEVDGPLIDFRVCPHTRSSSCARDKTRSGFSSRHSSNRKSVGPRRTSREPRHTRRVGRSRSRSPAVRRSAIRSGRVRRSSARTRAINSGTENGLTT